MYFLNLKHFKKMAKITKCYNWRNKLNSEGKAAIDIRITKGKDRKYFSTNYYIEPRFWDEKKCEVKKTHPKFQSINARLNQLVYQFEQKEIELINTGKDFSVDDFFETDVNKQKFADWCETIITERRNTVSEKHKCLYHLVIKEVVALKKVSNFGIKDLDLNFLYKYQKYLLNKKLNPKTINKRMQMLSMFINEAIKTGILKPSENCFLDYKNLKETDSERLIPTPEDVERLEKLNLDYNKNLDLVRDLFVFNCYIGLRNKDLFDLTYDNLKIENGEYIITLIESKTKKLNRRNVSVLGYGKGVKILEKYKGKDEKFLFPKLTDKKIRDGVVMLRTIINAKVPFTFYGSRHFCLSDLASRNIGVNDLQDFAKHSDIRTTQYYLHAQSLEKNLRNAFKQD